MKSGYLIPAANGYWIRSAVLSAVAVFAIVPSILRAATPPTAAINDSRYDLGYLVVTHYGATPNDNVDDTDAIQTAIQDAYDNDLVLFFPLGTYQIKDTLRCRQWHDSNGTTTTGCGAVTPKFAANPFKTHSFKLVGEHGSDGERPLIELVPTNNLFDQPSVPRPMLMLRLYEATIPNYTHAANWTEPQPDSDIMAAPPSGWRIDTSYLYNCELRNINFDCNGHSGAIGVAWPAAQGSLVESVKVFATGAYAGFYGLPGRHWGGINLAVDGGEYGIMSGYGAGNLAVAGVALTGVTLHNQVHQAIAYKDFVPLVVTGFEITKDIAAAGNIESPIIVQESATNSSYNTMCLLDGSITLTNFGGTTNIPAISNPGDGATSGKGLYVRNVYVKGTTRQIGSTGGNGVHVGGTGNWSRVNEYCFNDLRGSDGSDNNFFEQTGDPCAKTTYNSLAARSLLDGGPLGSASEPIISGAGTANVSLPADIVSRHLPEGGFPYYDEGVASPQTLVVTGLTDSASPTLGASVADANRAAIQVAIDTAATSATYQGRVFIPKGVYQIRPAGVDSNPSTTTPALTLLSNTKLFGAGKDQVCRLVAHSSWKPVNAVGVFVQTEDADDATTYLGSLDLSLLDYYNEQGPTSYNGQNLYKNPFTFVDWRAGPGSVSFDLSTSGGYRWTTPTLGAPPFVCLKYSGNGGGRHYFIPIPDQGLIPISRATLNGAYRSVLISGTHWPLWFYGFNVEGGKNDARDTDTEITGASNVVMLGCKREGGAPAITMNNSHNIMLLGSGSMKEDPAVRTGSSAAGYYQVNNSNCDGIVMANLLVQNATATPTGYTVKETSSGGSGAPFPLGVSLYKRGTFNYTDASPTTRAVYLPSKAADDGWVLGVTTGTSKDSGGTGYQALRVGDDNTGKQYKSILSFDTSSLGSNAVITEAELSVYVGGLVGSPSAPNFPANFFADIKSGTFGAQGLELTDFNAASTQMNVVEFQNVPSAAPLTIYGPIISSAWSNINRTGLTQFRLYFTTATDYDSAADYVGLCGGNNADSANWPYLYLVYHKP